VIPAHAQLRLESVSCPLGCPPNDNQVLVGKDRLHGLPGEFAVVHCSHCGLMRTNPRPTAETLGHYYPENYGPYGTTKIRIPSPAAEPRKKRRGLLRRIKSRFLDTDTRKIPPLRPGLMLEIGCASGSFLYEMAQRGWQVKGLEFSEEAADAARRAGYAVHTGTLETAPDPTETYDLIVGWHVFEHMPDPIYALCKLYRWTNTGGWLALSMPDAGSWEFKVFGNRWYALQLPTHLYHYTPRTLSNVLTITGWRVERIFWHNNPNNLFQSLRYYCLDHGWNSGADYLLAILEGRRQRRLHLLLAKLLGSLHASGRMTVWAQRV